MTPLELSRAYLRRVRDGDDVERVLRAIDNVPTGVLRATLHSDTRKRVFWANMYNAAVRDYIKTNPNALENRLQFFRRPMIRVAGHQLSLNTIEHGILRRNRPTVGLGFVRLPTISRFKQSMQPTTLDARLHFLLNCGALSCPPITILHEETYSTEADEATRQYLQQHAQFNMADSVVHLPRIFKWYIGDFGGQKGVLSFLREYNIIPTNATPTITYRPYDWSVDEAPFQ